MRWSLQPLRFLKSAACVASVFTMCFAPLAQGKAVQSNRQKVNEFMKSSGLSKGVTVGDYWKLVRHAYPAPLRGQVDLWVALNRNQMMPKVEATTVKDRNGVEQVRLTMNRDGKNLTVTLTGDKAKPMKVNNVVLTAKELTNYKSYSSLMKKIMTQDPTMKKALPMKPLAVIGRNPVLSFKEYKALTPRQRAEYLYNVRITVQAAQQVYKVKFGAQAANELERKYEFAFKFLFGADAEAAKASSLTGKPCVFAGYLTLYGENGSCGGETEGAAHFKAAQKASIASCPGSDVPCHPMVYGYKSDGSNYCIPHANRKVATSLCNKASPKDTPQDKKRIIESYLAKRGKNVNLVLVDGKVSQDQYAEISGYLTDLNKYIDEAIGECDRDPLLSVQKMRPDQKSACDAIRVRAFGLQQFATSPIPVVLPANPPTPPTVSTCDDPAKDINPDGTCGQCKAGSEPGQGQKEDGTTGEVCNPIVVVPVAAGGDLPGAKEEPKEKEDKCDGFLCIAPIWWGVAGVTLVGLGLWAALRDKDDDDDDDPPVQTPPIATDPGTPVTPVTPVEPPITVPNPECLLPRVIQNNQCVLIIDTLPPPDLSSEGGTLVPAPGSAGGVR